MAKPAIDALASELAPATKPRAYSAAAEARMWRLLALLVVTGLIWVVFNQLTDGVFLTSRNLTNLSVQMSMTALVAIGMTALLVARELDLSVGSLFALVTVASVYVQVKLRWNAIEAIAVALVLGLVVGAFQGYCTTRLKIPSFIVTLAGFSYLQGTAYAISGAETLSGTTDTFRVIANGTVPIEATLALGMATYAIWAWVVLKPARLLRGQLNLASITAFRPAQVLGTTAMAGVLGVALWAYFDYKGLPFPVAMVAAATLIWVFVSGNTAFGRHVYAIGGNPEAARRSGIRVERVVLVLFCCTGLLAAISGLIEASRLDSGPPNVGLFLALDAISAAVVGGTSLFGGYGGVTGTLLGTLILASIQNGLSLMGVNTFYQYIASGLILLVVVAIDAAARQRAQRV